MLALFKKTQQIVQKRSETPLQSYYRQLQELRSSSSMRTKADQKQYWKDYDELNKAWKASPGYAQWQAECEEELRLRDLEHQRYQAFMTPAKKTTKKRGSK